MDHNSQERMSGDQLYHCSICTHKAHEPVLTRCGHLFCWHCYYRKTNKQPFCPLCQETTTPNEIYPLFIDHDLPHPPDSELPDRPAPVNKPKIPNADMIGTRNQHNRNNIVMGRPLAGSLFLPALGITMLSQMGEPQEGQPQKVMHLRLKVIFVATMTVTAVLFGLYLLL